MKIQTICKNKKQNLQKQNLQKQNLRISKFTCASFENNWALLLRQCGKREKNRNVDHSPNNYE